VGATTQTRPRQRQKKGNRKRSRTNAAAIRLPEEAAEDVRTMMLGRFDFLMSRARHDAAGVELGPCVDFLRAARRAFHVLADLGH